MNDCHFIHKAKFLLMKSYLRLFYLYSYQLFSFQLFLFTFRLHASSCLYKLISFPLKQQYEEQPESQPVKDEVGERSMEQSSSQVSCNLVTIILPFQFSFPKTT